MNDCTWEKVDGRYVCMAKKCPHWRETGCELGKVTLTCENEECKWNVDMHCKTMDVYLDADGKCLGMRKKGEK